MNMLRYLFLLLPLLSTWHTFAQEIAFTATVDRNSIAVGEHVKLTITLVNSRESFNAPDLGGLVIDRGPFESSSFNYVNGRMTSSVSRTWMLTATRPGKYTIGAASVRVGGGVITTEPITIEVAKGSAPPADPGVAQGQGRDPNLFVTISLSKNKAYVGEQVVASYVLYSRYPNIELSKYDLPKLDGFWTEEIDLGDAGWEERPQVINGLQYRVAVLKKQLLFPQRSGRLRIEPMSLTCVVNRSFFSRGTAIDVTSNAVELTALELPPNAPAEFSGAVGELQMNVSADRTEVNADQAIELSVRISGRANLKLLDAPNLTPPAEFEVYDPKVNDKISIGSNGMAGHREFQYLMIPRHDGTYELDGVTFGYFDPKAGEYRTLRSGPLTIDMAPGEMTTMPGSARVSGREVQVLEHDIRYIRTGDLELRRIGEWLFGSARWITAMLAPTLAFLLFLGWYRTKRSEESDVAGMRRKKADKLARRRLSEAEKALAQNDREGFYAALHKALNGYLADKFGLGMAEMNSMVVKERLSVLTDGTALAEGYTRLIAICEMARYAPIEEVPRKELHAQAMDLIGRIEQRS